MTHEELHSAVAQVVDGRPYSVCRRLFNYDRNGGGRGEEWAVCVHEHAGTAVLTYTIEPTPELALLDVCAQLERSGATP